MKKFLILAISAIVILTFVGCNRDDNNNDMNDATDAPTASSTLDDATTLPELLPSDMPGEMFDDKNNNNNN